MLAMSAAVALPRCPVAAFLHVDCPGCGTTRAFGDLLRGDAAAAFDHNVLAMAAIPIVLAALVFWLVPRTKPAWVLRLATAPATPRAVLAIVVVFTVVRNTPLLGGYLGST